MLAFSSQFSGVDFENVTEIGAEVEVVNDIEVKIVIEVVGAALMITDLTVRMSLRSLELMRQRNSPPVLEIAEYVQLSIEQVS